MFQLPPIHSIGEGGIPALGLQGWLNPEHLTLDRLRFPSHTYHLGRRPQQDRQGHTGAALRKRGDKQGPCGSRLCGIEKMGYPLAPWEDVTDLAE